MNVSPVRTRLLKRNVDIGSLKIEDVLKFVRSGGHNTQQGREYLVLIINHFTRGKYVRQAQQMAELAT